MKDMFFFLVLGLSCCTEASSEFLLDRPRLSAPSEALVKAIVSFQCEISNPNNQSILLKLFKEGDRKNMFGEYTLLPGKENGHIPKIINRSHEGYFECEASMQNNTQINATISQTHYLKVIEPVKDAEIIHSGPNELFEGSNLDLHCTVKKGNHESYKWLRDGQLISPSPFHRMAHNRLIIYRASSNDSGSYMCTATNIFNQSQVFTSNSSEVVITVKDLVSNPDISFTVLKEKDQNYSAVITCQSDRGAPPITFSLYSSTTALIHNVTAGERLATFKVPVILDQHLGWFQCQANNGDLATFSHWLPLNVVSVGGPVTIQSSYDTAENYAVIGLRFYCKAAKGSHPRFQWFLNNTLLPNRGNFYYVFDQLPEQSILLLSVGRSSTGTYHCEVSDSFDNTTAISSEKRYVDKEALNRLPVFLVAVVFGCFTLLILLVTFCCLFGAFSRRQFGEKPLLNLEMNQQLATVEDERELSINREDPDEIKAPKEHEFYQDSDTSADEWPEIDLEWKKLEDEEV